MKQFKVRIAAALTVLGLMIRVFSVSSEAQNDRQLTRENLGTNEARTALVIGNGAYRNVSTLDNPVNDARDMSEALRSLGFEVISGTDAGLVEMRRLIREFGEKLEAKKGIGLVFYAGHGVEVRGKNFLIPIDADIKREVETEDYAIDVNSILRQMDAAGNGFNIVILDACRNNPFSRGWSRSADTGGLANVTAPTGTYIAYAAAPGTTASDGKGTRNGVFTGALLKNLRKPDLKLEEVFKSTREEVMTVTSNKQVPWDSSSIKGDFYFMRTAATAVVPSGNTTDPVIEPKTEAAQEREAWDLVKNSSDPGDLRIFLKEFPTGANAGNARIKLEETVWQAAKVSDDKAKVQAYLDEFPNGANSAAARIKLRQLESATPIGGGKSELTATVRKSALGIELVWILPGEFLMGSPNDEKMRDIDEGTPERVKITSGFWMGRFEVTQAQWRSVMALPSSNCYGADDVQGDSRPVVCVSLKDVRDFIARLNAQDKEFVYRLPFEVEWEYAARAGSTTRFYWGEDPTDEQICRYANVADLTAIEKSQNRWLAGWANKGCRDGYAGTAPVGSFPHNGFGLYDMSGNVYEWVEDPYSSRANTDTSQIANVGTSAVVRGGSWYDGSGAARSANRTDSGVPSNDKGFRLVARQK